MNMMDRWYYNLKIIEKLLNIIKYNPNLRFHQILQIYRIEEPEKDKFYEESKDTLKGIEDFISKRN